jgi:hypothetical protein
MSKVTILLLIFSTTIHAQTLTNRYFVSFKDKANSPFSISNPSQFLSQKSINRRSKENFITIEEDLPVNQTYVQQVKATGAEVYFTSRWLNGLLIQTSPSIASLVSNLSFVSNVELVGWGSRLNARLKATKKSEQVEVATSLQNLPQMKMIGLDKMHNEGFYGEGIDVAIFDAGFIGVNTQAAFQPIYQQGRLKGAFNYVINSTDVYSAASHGAWVMSIMSGNLASYLGGVPNANFYLYQTEDVDSEYRVEEYNWLFAAEKADSAGVDVINSSVGYSDFDDPSMSYIYKDLDGKTSVVARAAHKAFERGIVIVNSAGNEGSGYWKYIVTPADAAGVISCGAVDSLGVRASFSSIGPSSDGRIKPDVSAMGVYTLVIDTDGIVKMGNGTSFSSPLVACLAAGLRQVFPNASAAEIYSRVINSASQANHPDDFLGYGIPDFEGAKTITDFDSDFVIYPNPTNGLLKIFFKSPQGETLSTVIFNSTGQKVFESTGSAGWSDNPIDIDLSSLSAGIYLLKAQINGATKTIRVVKVN